MNASMFPHKLSNPTLLRSEAFIGGKWVAALDGDLMPVDDPSTGNTIAYVPNLRASDFESTAATALHGFQYWRTLTGRERGLILRKWGDLIRAHADDLALIITTEMGKPLGEARSEVDYSVSLFEWYGEEASRAYGEVVPSSVPDRRIFLVQEPIGVVFAITPWNFPAAMVARKIVPALAAGCSVILKPAPETPLTALALANLAEIAGVPDGVFNVVTGDEEKIGTFFTNDYRIRMVTCTGSTQVGSWLMKNSADTLKRLSLELGGNAPFIVLPDANLELAVEALVKSKFRASGQTCVCPNNILVPECLIEEFLSQLLFMVKKLKVGPGTETGVDVGPIIREEAITRLETIVREACENGMRLVLGGKRSVKGSRFFCPTVIVGRLENHNLIEQEIFGPIVMVYAYHNLADVLAKVNSSKYGLAGYIFGSDLRTIWATAESLECGVVGINTGATAAAELPFGGIKHSGMGKEGGRQGLHEFCQIKAICLGGI